MMIATSVASRSKTAGLFKITPPSVTVRQAYWIDEQVVSNPDLPVRERPR
jgi:hypothetical protein